MTKTWLVEITQSGNTIRIPGQRQRDAMQLAEYTRPVTNVQRPGSPL